MIRALFRSLLLVALLSPALPAPLAAQAADSVRRSQEGRGLVIGLAALAALGFILHERNEDRREERKKRAQTLPGECLVAWPTREGNATLYDPDCLDARLEASASLPLGCAVTVRSEGRFVSGFSPRCLREEGWHTED
jgi:hypothetical protein